MKRLLPILLVLLFAACQSREADFEHTLARQIKDGEAATRILHRFGNGSYFHLVEIKGVKRDSSYAQQSQQFCVSDPQGHFVYGVTAIQLFQFLFDADIRHTITTEELPVLVPIGYDNLEAFDADMLKHYGATSPVFYSLIFHGTDLQWEEARQTIIDYFQVEHKVMPYTFDEYYLSVADTSRMMAYRYDGQCAGDCRLTMSAEQLSAPDFTMAALAESLSDVTGYWFRTADTTAARYSLTLNLAGRGLGGLTTYLLDTFGIRVTPAKVEEPMHLFIPKHHHPDGHCPHAH